MRVGPLDPVADPETRTVVLIVTESDVSLDRMVVVTDEKPSRVSLSIDPFEVEGTHEIKPSTALRHHVTIDSKWGAFPLQIGVDPIGGRGRIG